MKHLRAKDSYVIEKHSRKKYEIITMPLDEMVPASIYEEIPDHKELEESIKDGVMDHPVMLWPMTQKYWKEIHLKFYRRGNPTLPEQAPEKDGEVLVVWKGRQRYQMAKDMGFTHIDCVIEPDLDKIVRKAQEDQD